MALHMKDESYRIEPPMDFALGSNKSKKMTTQPKLGLNSSLYHLTYDQWVSVTTWKKIRVSLEVYIRGYYVNSVKWVKNLKICPIFRV